MNEIEQNQEMINRLSENPIYQEFTKIKQIITLGERTEAIIEKLKVNIQQIAYRQQQMQMQNQQQQQFQQQFQQQPQQMQNQQLAQAGMHPAQALQRGRVRPSTNPVNAPRQNLDSFGNPIIVESDQQERQKFDTSAEELGTDEKAPIDGVPDWAEDNEQN
jgi:hypothetical protein